MATLLLAMAWFFGATPPDTVSQQSFSFHGTAYRFSVFTPGGFNGGDKLPVLLLIHGAGGKGLDILNNWKEFAARQRILLVAPDFPLDAAFETTVPELFSALMDAVRATWHFDSRRVYVFGYSAGSYAAFDAAALDSNYFAAAAVFAGIITPDYDGIVLQAKRKTPIAIYIGTSDQFFTLAQTRRTRDLLEKNHFPVHYVELANRDHNYGAVSAEINADAWKFMSQYSLP